MFRVGPRLLLLSLVCALVASVLQAAPTAASAPDPLTDKPKLPASCIREPGGMTYKAGPCYLTKFRKHRPTVVLWGDSHSWQQLPALRPLARLHDVNLVMFMLGGCAPILVPEAHPADALCLRAVEPARAHVRAQARAPGSAGAGPDRGVLAEVPRSLPTLLRRRHRPRPRVRGQGQFPAFDPQVPQAHAAAVRRAGPHRGPRRRHRAGGVRAGQSATLRGDGPLRVRDPAEACAAPGGRRPSAGWADSCARCRAGRG